jgi:hypothetical protein
MIQTSTSVILVIASTEMKTFVSPRPRKPPDSTRVKRTFSSSFGEHSSAQ